jgi:hypothetical protein
MAKIHTYFVVERGTLSAANWDALCALFAAMGEHDTPFPMYNNHSRARLDGDAVIYESDFDTTEVSIEAFKQLLADAFGVPVQDIDDAQTEDNYTEYGTTTTWTIQYGGIDRFIIRRFSGGSTWQDSRLETLGYLKLYKNEWESE